MKEYRITKYNPQNRVNGIYIVNEWTSISDVGKTFDAGVLLYTQYKKVEKAYTDCCVALIRCAGISKLSVCCPEYYDTDIRFPTDVSNEWDIRQIVMCCLQEKCWVKLEAENFFVGFGYDYYMYIGCTIPRSLVEELSQRYGLFCEVFPSPYNTQPKTEDDLGEP